MASAKTIVLITGANSGIGYCTAECLAASSSDYHIIVCSRNLERGQKALSDLQKQNPKGSFSLVQLDVTDQESINSAAESVAKHFGRLDVLINNAGIIAQTGSLITDLRATFETNTFGPAIVTEAFAPLLSKSKNGRLVYVSSGLGSLTIRSDPSDRYYKNPGVTYRMSKAALNMLAICHHVALGPQGIKVWTFCPGYVVTNLSGTGEKGRRERVERGAGDPKESADGILAIVEGRRDSEVGKFVHKDGVYPW